MLLQNHIAKSASTLYSICLFLYFQPFLSYKFLVLNALPQKVRSGYSIYKLGQKYNTVIFHKNSFVKYFLIILRMFFSMNKSEANDDDDFACPVLSGLFSSRVLLRKNFPIKQKSRYAEAHPLFLLTFFLTSSFRSASSPLQVRRTGHPQPARSPSSVSTQDYSPPEQRMQ